MRIGELAERVGVSAHTLRAWERRYGLLSPQRTPSGYRMYSHADERRARSVRDLVEQRVPASQAVARVLAAERGALAPPAADAFTAPDQGAPDQGAPDRGEPDRGEPDRGAQGGATRPAATGATRFGADFRAAVLDYDDAAAQEALDQLLRDVSIDLAIEQEILPFLADLGERWAAGEVAVSHEHFASQLIRRRLGAFSTTWSHGSGPVAMLAALPTEHHDIALLSLGVLLGRAGWRVRYLGADTPVEDVARAAQTIRPDAIVLSTTRPETVAAHRDAIARVAQRHPVWLGGRGAADRPAPRHTHVLRGGVAASVRDLQASIAPVGGNSAEAAFRST